MFNTLSDLMRAVEKCTDLSVSRVRFGVQVVDHAEGNSVFFSDAEIISMIVDEFDCEHMLAVNVYNNSPLETVGAWINSGYMG